MSRELIAEKNQLVTSEEYKRIRDLQINHILDLSNSSTDPVLIKGMLKLIDDTDNWQKQFEKEKAKKE